MNYQNMASARYPGARGRLVRPINLRNSLAGLIARSMNHRNPTNQSIRQPDSTQPMKTLVRIALAAISFSLLSAAAPVGICLHASSPEAPADKIECFEFEKSERVANEHRFFIDSERSWVITSFRFRGTIPYMPELTPGNPVFDKLLKLYEETARATPSTRRYLNPKILVMRNLAAGYTQEKQRSESKILAETAKQTEANSKMPSVTLADGTVLKGCKATKMDGTFVSLMHTDGIKKIKIADLSEESKKALNLDSLTKNVASASDGSAGGVGKPPAESALGQDKPTVENEHPGKDAFAGGFVLPGEEAQERSQPKPRQLKPTEVSPLLRLALNYYEGNGVVQNYAEAVKLFQKAADQGDAEAQYSLSKCYRHGVGVYKNETVADIWIRSAAEKGLPKAQVGLAISYQEGNGVTRNYAEAVKWYLKAAEQGDIDSQLALGLCYAKGEGVNYDVKEANKWNEKAAENGDRWAQFLVGMFYKDGFKVITPDYPRAVNWFRKSAAQEHAQAQIQLGICYGFGLGIPLDEVEAVKWFRKAAEAGSVNLCL